jgi:hypothetical protein
MVERVEAFSRPFDRLITIPLYKKKNPTEVVHSELQSHNVKHTPTMGVPCSLIRLRMQRDLLRCELVQLYAQAHA